MGEGPGAAERDFWECPDDAEALARFRALANVVDAGVYQLDAEGRFVAVDETAVETTGYAREDLVGEGLSLLFEGADGRRVERAIEERFESGGHTGALELTLRTADGDALPCELRLTAVDRDGERRGAVGTIRTEPTPDGISTEQQERERQLEKSRQRYRTLVENFPNGAVALVDDDLRYQTVGGQPTETADTTVDSAEGTPVADAVPPDLADELVPSYEAALDGEAREFEIERDGRVFHFRTVPIRGDDGEIFGALGVSQDITDRREAKRRLAESERRYRTLVEHFPNGAVGLFDEDLRYQVAGGEAFDELGTSAEEVAGKTLWERYPEEIAERLEPKFRAAIDGEASEFEWELHDRYWLSHTIPVRDEAGEVFGGMITVQDITDRREYEQRLEESNERLEQFAYAASHDLQEPLRMVRSYLRLIEQRYGDEFDEDGEEFIEFAVDGADRMREMIDGLLAYSRVDTRGDPFEPVDLDAVLADVRQDLEVKIEESGAEITVEDLPVVEGDGGQLRQLFQNLLENAIEYSGDGPPRIHVTAARQERDRRASDPPGPGEESDRWVISVRDEGIGIDPEEADRIFEIFQRLHTRDEHEGSGIGLALCERIVDRHGGEIWVESEPGEGSTFSFTLPTAQPER